MASAKANSQFMRSKDLLEYYYLNRPMGKQIVEAPALVIAGSTYQHGTPTQVFASPIISTAAERQQHLQSFNMIKDELAQVFFTIEFDVILKTNFELDTIKEE